MVGSHAKTIILGSMTLRLKDLRADVALHQHHFGTPPKQ